MAELRPDVDVDRHLAWSVGAAFLATAIVYLTIPGIGHALFGRYGLAAACLGGAALCALLTYRFVHHIGWERWIR